MPTTIQLSVSLTEQDAIRRLQYKLSNTSAEDVFVQNVFYSPFSSTREVDSDLCFHMVQGDRLHLLLYAYSNLLVCAYVPDYPNTSGASQIKDKPNKGHPFS